MRRIEKFTPQPSCSNSISGTSAMRQRWLIYYMKSLIIVILFFSSVWSFGQFDRFTSVNASLGFDFKTKGLGTNDAGFGLMIDGSLFANHKFQLLIENSEEVFIGNKLLVADSLGRKAKSDVINSIRAGAQIFLSRNIAISTTYGPAWHRIYAYEFTRDFGFLFSITTFLGHDKRFTSKLFMATISGDVRNIKYFGFRVGYRLC